jgi:hypothetical protein
MLSSSAHAEPMRPTAGDVPSDIDFPAWGGEPVHGHVEPWAPPRLTELGERLAAFAIGRRPHTMLVSLMLPGQRLVYVDSGPPLRASSGHSSAAGANGSRCACIGSHERRHRNLRRQPRHPARGDHLIRAKFARLERENASRSRSPSCAARSPTSTLSASAFASRTEVRSARRASASVMVETVRRASAAKRARAAREARRRRRISNGGPTRKPSPSRRFYRTEARGR